MKVVSFLLSFVITILYCTGLSATHYPSSRIERYAINTPRVVENNLSSLTRHLTRSLDDDYDKAKMIAFWIASHINYDKYLYNESGATTLFKRHKQQSPEELLKSRVGICGEFAALFEAMCRIAGINTSIVTGYAYPAKYRLSRKEKINAAHAWNYFLYRGKKVYVDTTFMAEGTTSPTRRLTETSHKRALREVFHDNKHKSQVNGFNAYYFDFNYKDEIRDTGYKREEK